jgi:hypothetical protein
MDSSKQSNPDFGSLFFLTAGLLSFLFCIIDPDCFAFDGTLGRLEGSRARNDFPVPLTERPTRHDVNDQTL